MNSPSLFPFGCFSPPSSDQRVRYQNVEDSCAYFSSSAAQDQDWYGRIDAFICDPPWGCLKEANGPGQPDEAIEPNKICAFARGIYGAGSTNALSATRLTLDIYMDWKRAFEAAGWLVQDTPIFSYKGAPYIQQRNTKRGHLSGKM